MANRYTGIALTLAAIGALCAGSDAALAKQKGRKGKKTDKAQLELAGDASDTNARGTVEITDKKRGKHGVIKLRNLDPKTIYDVIDSGTGELLGVVRTNRKGRANFEMGVGAANKPVRASSVEVESADDEASEEPADDSGDDGMGGGRPDGTWSPDDKGDGNWWVVDCGDPADIPLDEIDGVEIVCEETDETILTCNFGEAFADFEYAFGSSWDGDEATGIFSATLSHYSDGEWSDDSFSAVFYPGSDEYYEWEGDDAETYGKWWRGYEKPHSYWASTSAGNELPFGVASASELGGLEYQITTEDGSEVVMSGVLPKVESIKWDEPVVIDPIWEGEWDWQETGDWGDDWSDDFGDDSDDWGNDPAGGANGQMPFRSDEREPDGDWTWPEPTVESTYLLLLRNPASGEFEKVANLEYLTWDWEIWIDDGGMTWDGDGTFPGWDPATGDDNSADGTKRDNKRRRPARGGRGGR